MRTISLKMTATEIALLDEIVQHWKFASRSQAIRKGILLLLGETKLKPETKQRLKNERCKVKSRRSKFADASVRYRGCKV